MDSGRSLAVNDCEFDNNVAISGGGAIYGRAGTSINIADSKFHDNRTSENGGAIEIIDTAAMSTDATHFKLSYCELTNNKADFDGGAVALFNFGKGGTTAEISDTKFSKNQAGDIGGGGLWVSGKVNITIAVSKFLENKAVALPPNGLGNGGGIGLSGSSVSADILNVSIESNSAKSNGGGLWMSSSKVSIKNSTIAKNVAGGKGAGVFNSGKAADVILNNCTVPDNTVNVTEGKGAGGVGAGIFGSVTLVNTIVFGNTSNDGTSQTKDDVAGAITSRGHNLIGDPTGSSGWVASDLLNVNDAGLVDAGDFYLLRPTSPAIDSGDDSYSPDDFDQRREPFDRILGDAIDIGSIEAPPNSPPAIRDDLYITYENVAVSGNVLDNDEDVDGDNLTASLEQDPTHGTLTFNSDGSFTYAPDTDWYGTDYFIYSATCTARVLV